jgi:hypothetical protein
MRALAIILSLLAILSSIYLAIPQAKEDVQTVSQKLLLETVRAEDLDRIRITAWDARNLKSQYIEIERRGLNWVLPQHYFYKANAGTRIGDLAGSLLNIEIAQPILVSNDDLNEYHLHDPQDELAGDVKYGRRLGLWTKDGSNVLDVIIGAEVPNEMDKRYMRFVDSNQVYQIHFDQDLPVRFVDWVQTTLLEIDPQKIRYLQLRQYSFDEQRQRLRPGLSVQFARNRADGLWQSPNAPDKHVTNDAAVYRILRAVVEANIHGVEPFVKDPEKIKRFGFFPNYNIGIGAGSDPIVGNEGVVVIGTSDGIFYNLFLGELASLAENELGAKRYRYMLVACRYDIKSDDAYDGRNAKELMQQGTEKVKDLNKEFGKYFYIIEDDDFKKLRPDVFTLYKKPEMMQ